MKNETQSIQFTGKTGENTELLVQKSEEVIDDSQNAPLGASIFSMISASKH